MSDQKKNGSPGLPILRGNYADPTILRVGRDYYLTHSCNQYAPAFLIWHSTDLLHWAPLEPALVRYDGDIWAPDLVFHGGRFFLYYTTAGGNHVITAPTIMGPWSTPVALRIPHIDPGHVAGLDGTRYLYWSNGHVVELTADGLALAGEVRKVYDGWIYPASWRTEGKCLEGPKLFVKEDWYYMVSAQGGTAGPATSHMVIVARSSSPLGPWENSPHNPLIRTASPTDRWWSRGHGTIFETAEGGWRIIYHAYENGYRTLGRINLMQTVEWTPEGWPVVGVDSHGAIETPKLGFAALSDDFTADRLGWQWQFHGSYDPGRFTVGDGSLKLEARGKSPAEGSEPLCLLPRHHAYRVSVNVQIEGHAQAGILLFYDPRNYVGIALESGRIVLLRPHGAQPILDVPSAGLVSLRLVNDRHDIELWTRSCGEEWRQVEYSFEASGWHHNALGGFNSLRVGLCAGGDGMAVFRRFVYESLSTG